MFITVDIIGYFTEISYCNASILTSSQLILQEKPIESNKFSKIGFRINVLILWSYGNLSLLTILLTMFSFYDWFPHIFGHYFMNVSKGNLRLRLFTWCL